MGHVLIWSVTVVVLSLLVLLQAFVRRMRLGSLRVGAIRPFFVSAVVLVVVTAISTLPKGQQHGFWSDGQTLAPGILLGGVAVLLAAWLTARSDAEAAENGTSAWEAAAIAAAPALGVGALLLGYSTRMLDALGGFSIGALVVGALAGMGPPLAGLRSEAAAAAERSTVLAVALAAATYLATLHRTALMVREWEPLPALFVAAAAVLLAARASFAAERRPWLNAALMVILPLLALSAVIAYRLHGAPGFLPAVSAGMVSLGLIAWREALDQEPDGETEPSPLSRSSGSGLLGALLLLGAAAVAYHELHGYGISLVALAAAVAWIALPRPRSETGGAGAVLVPGAVSLALAVALFRIYQQKVEPELSFRPEEIYYYCSLLAGALLPPLLAGLAVDRTPPGGDGGSRSVLGPLVRVGLAGLAAAGAPLVVWLLVGERAQAAFVIGLVVAAGLTMRTVRAGEPTAEPALARLLTLCCAITAIQLTHVLAPLGDLTRRQRIEILVGVAGAVLLVLATASFLQRRSRIGRRESQSQPAADIASG